MPISNNGRSLGSVSVEERIVEQEAQTIQQTTLILPYFDYEVPLLSLGDRSGYIPVVALCRMLGLNPRTHIPRWRRLFLWEHARKLPLRTATRGTRIVWCLHLGALFLWCSSFNWSLVSPERQEQLRQATDAGLKRLEQAHQEMLTHYRQMRHLLFRFLTDHADAKTHLRQLAAGIHPHLDAASSTALDMLIEEGCTLIDGATVHARAILQDQATIPIMDVFSIDAEGNAIEVGSLPLFPVIGREDEEQFFAQIDKLTRWYCDLARFLIEKGTPHKRDHEDEQ
jgi:hypothetical protein